MLHLPPAEDRDPGPNQDDPPPGPRALDKPGYRPTDLRSGRGLSDFLCKRASA